MKKEKYERTELDIIRFMTSDVIMLSNPLEEDDELPIRGNQWHFLFNQGAGIRSIQIICLRHRNYPLKYFSAVYNRRARLIISVQNIKRPIGSSRDGEAVYRSCLFKNVIAKPLTRVSELWQSQPVYKGIIPRGLSWNCPKSGFIFLGWYPVRAERRESDRWTLQRLHRRSLFNRDNRWANGYCCGSTACYQGKNLPDAR